MALNNSLTYLANREVAATKRVNRYLTNEARVIKRNMAIHRKKIEDDIRAFYQRYADKERLTYQEAQQAVSQFDVAAFEVQAQAYVASRDFSSQANFQLRLYNTKMKISKLELLLNHIQLEMNRLADQTTKELGKALDHVYELELKRQAGILGESLTNVRIANQALLKSHHRGVTFADFWGKNLAVLYHQIDEAVTSALLNGQHSYQLIGSLKGLFNVTQHQAERLLITETSFNQTRLQVAAFDVAGFKAFRFMAEPTACKLCEEYNQKVYELEEWLNSPTPPVHPFCRCSLVPEEDFLTYESGGRIRSESEQFEIAERMYQSFRNRRSDVQRVAKHTGFAEREVQKVYNHLFINKYPLAKGYRRFDADYDIAQSWQRLFLGKEIKAHDLTLLEHELLEYLYMSQYNMSYQKAHQQASSLYNYQKAVVLFKERS